jgi:hypothetical protein
MVTAMGHLWREKGVDYGVDGEIELVNDGQALNRVLWVQSKAQGDAQRFSGETERGFRYMCRQVDIDYWLSGTAPVILVCSHPDSVQAWFKHLPSWFADAKRRRERYVEFDKEHDRFDASAGRALLNLGADAASGVYLRPPPRHETLTTNLLAVDHVADQVHLAPSRCHDWSDANPRLIKAGHDLMSDVVFHGGNVYSFRRFDEPPLDVLADGAPEMIGTEELVGTGTETEIQLLRWLLNATVKDIFGRDLRFHPDRHYLYFRAPADGKDRKLRVGRGSGRTVVQRYEPAEGATWTAYSRHYALDSQFVLADGSWFLTLAPTYHFTSDGRADSAFSSRLLSKIKMIEGHEAIRSQTTFWARYLGQTATLLTGPPDPRLRFGRLVTADVERGIDDRSWKPRPSDETIDQDDGGGGGGGDGDGEELKLFDDDWAATR